MATDEVHSSHEEHHTTDSLNSNEAADEHHTTDSLNSNEAADDPCPLPRIHRVHQELRGNQKVYDPTVLSLGPYHHGKPKFLRTEEFKTKVFNMFILACVEKDEALYGSIFRRINEIRSHYEEVEWEDEKLARIILKDACFLIQWTENSETVTNLIIDRLGASMAVLMARDIYMLENQIPHCVITQLSIKRPYVMATLYFQSINSFQWLDVNPEEYSCRNIVHEPLHFLEAYRSKLIEQESTDEVKLPVFSSNSQNKLQAKPPAFLQLTDHSPFHSATYLRKKGIRFKPSKGDALNCNNTTVSTVTFMMLKNIRFTQGVWGGTLYLPAFWVNKNTMALFSNIIAFELSPGRRTDYTVTSYVNLMKSLIETPEDIKLLQESGVLYSLLGNDDEVVKVFDEIETFGVGDRSILAEVVMNNVNEHCKNKGKKWMADLFHKHFISPWNAMALFAAALLLILTFIQTLFTILPDKKRP